MYLKIFFHRDYHKFSGGHLKVWDYFSHAQSSEKLQPLIYFTPTSVWDDSNPWKNSKHSLLKSWDPTQADVLFVAGFDWMTLPELPNIPVVNLIQGLSHAFPNDPKYCFLSRKAIRICVSEEVSAAIKSTGIVNGPVITIPNGLDTSLFPPPSNFRNIPLLIAGMKNPQLARTLSERLVQSGIPNHCQTEHLSRQDFLALLGRSKRAVFLPCEQEGFYLPAIEGMAMGAVVICPDCVGNRSFCLDGLNCFRPNYSLDSIMSGVHIAIQQSQEQEVLMKFQAMVQVKKHDLLSERRAFLKILETIL
jgi:glycosyltransferase involved in cell wall biosynthesis